MGIPHSFTPLFWHIQHFVELSTQVAKLNSSKFKYSSELTGIDAMLSDLGYEAICKIRVVATLKFHLLLCPRCITMI